MDGKGRVCLYGERADKKGAMQIIEELGAVLYSNHR